MARTSKKLIDTSILVDYLRTLPEAEDFLDSLRVRCISVVTAMEIIQGSRNKKELKINLSFLANFKIIRIDRKTSDVARELMKKYKLKYNLSIPDAFIGATAMDKNKILITKNVKDFQFIKGLEVQSPY